jgi:hypothetical protein
MNWDEQLPLILSYNRLSTVAILDTQIIEFWMLGIPRQGDAGRTKNVQVIVCSTRMVKTTT